MCRLALFFILFLFIGRESKRTYMTDGVKRNERSMHLLREYTFFMLRYTLIFSQDTKFNLPFG